jgi:hypothetical protein
VVGGLDLLLCILVVSPSLRSVIKFKGLMEGSYLDWFSKEFG